jgi:hypothetical protein
MGIRVLQVVSTGYRSWTINEQRSDCCPRIVTGYKTYVREDVDGIWNLDIFAFNLQEPITRAVARGNTGANAISEAKPISQAK